MANNTTTSSESSSNAFAHIPMLTMDTANRKSNFSDLKLSISNAAIAAIGGAAQFMVGNSDYLEPPQAKTYPEGQEITKEQKLLDKQILREELKAWIIKKEKNKESHIRLYGMLMQLLPEEVLLKIKKLGPTAGEDIKYIEGDLSGERLWKQMCHVLESSNRFKNIKDIQQMKCLADVVCFNQSTLTLPMYLKKFNDLVRILLSTGFEGLNEQNFAVLFMRGMNQSSCAAFLADTINKASREPTSNGYSALPSTVAAMYDAVSTYVTVSTDSSTGKARITDSSSDSTDPVRHVYPVLDDRPRGKPSKKGLRKQQVKQTKQANSNNESYCEFHMAYNGQKCTNHTADECSLKKSVLQAMSEKQKSATTNNSEKPASDSRKKVKADRAKYKAGKKNVTSEPDSDSEDGGLAMFNNAAFEDTFAFPILQLDGNEFVVDENTRKAFASGEMQKIGAGAVILDTAAEQSIANSERLLSPDSLSDAPPTSVTGVGGKVTMTRRGSFHQLDDNVYVLKSMPLTILSQRACERNGAKVFYDTSGEYIHVVDKEGSIYYFVRKGSLYHLWFPFRDHLKKFPTTEYAHCGNLTPIPRHHCSSICKTRSHLRGTRFQKRRSLSRSVILQ